MTRLGDWVFCGMTGIIVAVACAITLSLALNAEPPCPPPWKCDSIECLKRCFK